MAKTKKEVVKCDCKPVTCKAVALCLAKMAGMLALAVLAAGAVFLIEVKIYDVGNNTGFDQGVVKALDLNTPCERGTYISKWVDDKKYYCTFDKSTHEFKWARYFENWDVTNE